MRGSGLTLPIAVCEFSLAISTNKITALRFSYSISVKEFFKILVSCFWKKKETLLQSMFDVNVLKKACNACLREFK